MTSSINRLIDKQLKYSRLIKKLSYPDFAQKMYPCITISRETGSGGRLVAKKTAALLKIKYLNSKLVNLIAKTANKRKKLIKAVDEQTQDAIGSIVNTFLGYESLPEHAYIKSLSKVILSVAASNPAVILGRGANFILPKETDLRVRIVAPFSFRVYHSVKAHKRSEETIKKEIKKIHRERKEFVRKYFNKNISNANYYDLVINTQEINLDQASRIIAKAYKTRFIG